MKKKLIISKRSKIKGEDGYKTFSLRVKEEIVEELDRIAEETGRSRNEIISLMLDYGIENYEITEKD